MRRSLCFLTVLICIAGLTGAKLPRKGPLPAPRPDAVATDTAPADTTSDAPAQTSDVPAPEPKPAKADGADVPKDNAPETASSAAPKPSAEDTAAHAAWCKARYKSYNADTNRYRAFSGRETECVSPVTKAAAAKAQAEARKAAEAAAAKSQAETSATKPQTLPADETPTNTPDDKAATDQKPGEDAADEPADKPATNDGADTKAGEDQKPADEEKPAPPPPVENEDMAAYGACLVELKKIGADFVEKPRIDEGNGCGIDKPIEVSRILPGVALSPPATVRCETALELARMTRDFVIPAAKVGLPGKPALTSINQASGYICRNRNSAAEGKMSEHAKGNAIDIASLSFGKTTVPMQIIEPRDGSIEASFQRAIDRIACLFFSTVLAPGSDAAHEDHMHLDVIHRSHGYRICQ